MAKKILVVDDDKNIVEYLVAIFKDNGYETCEAYDGEAALKVLADEKPDLVTLDLEMPKEWGPRFYRKMTQTPGVRRHPGHCGQRAVRHPSGHQAGRGHHQQALRPR